MALKNGLAMEFPGNGAFVKVGEKTLVDFAAESRGFSIEGWFYLDTYANTRIETLVHKGTSSCAQYSVEIGTYGMIIVKAIFFKLVISV